MTVFRLGTTHKNLREHDYANPVYVSLPNDMPTSSSCGRYATRQRLDRRRNDWSGTRFRHWRTRAGGVIDGVVEKILKIYVYPDVAKQMAQAIRDRQAKKEYDTISSCQELAKVLTRHLREVCKDDHLSVDFFAKGIPYDSEKKPDPKDIEEFRQRGLRRNYEFKKVERLEGGIGLLQVDGFYPAEWIFETAAGAMAFLANSEAVILDLRQNSGGQSGGTLLCSYFFTEETHLTDFYNRPENTTRQIWSYPVADARSSRTRICTS